MEWANGRLWNVTAHQVSLVQVPVWMTCALACTPRDVLTHSGLAYFHSGWKLFPKFLHKTRFILLRKQGTCDHVKMQVVIKTITSNENICCTVGLWLCGFPSDFPGRIFLLSSRCAFWYNVGMRLCPLSKKREIPPSCGAGWAAQDCLVLFLLEIINAFVRSRPYTLNLGQLSLFPSSRQE